MNFWITKDNTEKLNNLSELTKGGLVNYLLSEYFRTHSDKEIEKVNEATALFAADPESWTKKYDFCGHNAVKGLCKKGCK